MKKLTLLSLLLLSGGVFAETSLNDKCMERLSIDLTRSAMRSSEKIQPELSALMEHPAFIALREADDKKLKRNFMPLFGKDGMAELTERSAAAQQAMNATLDIRRKWLIYFTEAMQQALTESACENVQLDEESALFLRRKFDALSELTRESEQNTLKKDANAFEKAIPLAFSGASARVYERLKEDLKPKGKRYRLIRDFSNHLAFEISTKAELKKDLSQKIPR